MERLEDNDIIEYELLDEEDGSVMMAADIKTYFEANPDAVEVLIFKGKKLLSISRYQVQNPKFNRLFRKKYEK